MLLKEMQPTVQQIVMAISAVLKLEVEIADHNLFRIAGTGEAKAGIWQQMTNEDFVYRECLRTGQPVIVERPGHHEFCIPCTHYQNCKEYGEVCSPILRDGEVVGVIGLIAFSEEQRVRLFSDLDAKIEFLDKMAEMIATKMKENELMEEQLIAERKLSTLISYIDNGVMIIDPDGRCHFLNQAARKLLELSDDEVPEPELIKQCVSSFTETKTDLWAGREVSDSRGKLIVVRNRNKFIHLFVTYHPSHSDEHAHDAVIVISDPKQMADVGLKYTEDSHRGFEAIIGNHPLVESLKEMLRKTANSYSPILLRGESGTGKEFIAESIHRYSARRSGAYLSLNCAVLPEKILSIQLFGNEDYPGKLVEASGGTLFLDDISDMPMSIQLKLLYILEEKMLWISGQQHPIPLDVRIITASDKDLEQFVRKGQFRQDLYYKLSVIPLEVPPLRARKEDILLLANHFLQLHCQTNRKYITNLTEDVKNILVTYHWPGNIRELSNIMEYAVNFSNHTTIGKEHLPEALRNIEIANEERLFTDGERYNLRDIEREVIQRAIHTAADRGEPKEIAARWLGISRATLFRKLQQYDIHE